VRIPRHNAVTGASFVWEQERFDPVTRCIFCYISLRDPASRQARPGPAALLHRTSGASQAGIMSRAQPACALACMCGMSWSASQACLLALLSVCYFAKVALCACVLWRPVLASVAIYGTRARVVLHARATQVLRRAFRYHWRLWTLPEVREMLLAAGFDDVRPPPRSRHPLSRMPHAERARRSDACRAAAPARNG